ncbi:MAG: TldD/PmbA family protein [Actinomycetota bacterium]
MPDRLDLPELCRAALAGARDGEEVEAYAGSSRKTEVRARRGEVDALSASESRGVGVRVVVGGRLGYAWAADPTEAEAGELLASARAGAEHATSDEANGLPPAAEAQDVPGLYRPSVAQLASDAKVSLALDLERAAVSARDEVKKVEDVVYADAVSRVAIVSTEGVDASYERTDCWCIVSALAERDGENQSGFSFRVAREPDELEWREAATEAAERGARLLGGRKPKTERLPVVLDPWAAASFLGVLASGLSAEEVQKGRSLLAGMVGEQVASGAVSLIDDGRLDDGPASAPFDDEGVPTGRLPVIERGVLRGFLHNTRTARREGASSTGNASRPSYHGVPGVSPSNLFVEPGIAGRDAILEQAGRAVYVQEVSGVHSGANPISGEFSVGATGLLVDGGELRDPLREMTIASTIPEVLHAIVAAGSDLRFFPGGGAIGTPTLLVGEMTVAGT